MLKNKIYNYFFNEIFKNFIIILFTFAAIAWVVRAVNFLDLLVDDGYSSGIYFKYSILNISTIVTRFVPLSFLLALTISIVKFEKKQEFLILWTTGLSKIKITNVFILIAFFITLLQLILSLFDNPYLLNISRSLLNDTDQLSVNSVLKSNEFSDTFKGLTFYIERKKSNDELVNIFIKDTSNNLNTLVEDSSKKKDSTIVAKRGFIDKQKLILFDGIIQTLNEKNEIKNVEFKKTELTLSNVSTRTITQPKIQETSSSLLYKCILDQNNDLNITNCSRKIYKGEVVQNLSRRLGSPLYIPLVSLIISFLIFYKKENRYNFLKKYMLFFVSFIILIFTEVCLKYTGISPTIAIFYFVFPVVLSVLLYLYLIKKIYSEKV